MRYHHSFVVVGVLVVLMVGGVSPSIAHETQTVEGYELTFGEANEPLITGERMWLELEIVDNETGEPVANQTETLNITIQKPGDENFTLDVSEQFGEPGVYEAPIIFTEPGEYVVHVKGRIEGTQFHIHFLVDVEDHAKLTYPSDESRNSTTQTARSS